MKKIIKISGLIILLLIGSVFAITLTKQQFINLDINNTDRNIQKIGWIKTIEEETNETFFNYIAEWDIIKEVDGEYPVIRGGCDYNINKRNYRLCKSEHNTTYCKQNLKDDIRTYCLHRLQVDKERELKLQEEAIASISDEDIWTDLQSLNVSLD